MILTDQVGICIVLSVLHVGGDDPKISVKKAVGISVLHVGGDDP